MSTQNINGGTPPRTFAGTPHATKRAASVLAYLLLLTAVLVSALPVQAGEKSIGGKRTLDTMTVNLYIGAGVERVLAVDPNDPSELIKAVTGVYYELLASQPPVRLQAVADQIAARKPDIVAVEEATLLRLQSPGDLVLGGTTPATDVVLDYLQILVNALKARGAHYAVVSSSQEWDIEMPMLHLDSDGNPIIIGWIDEEPIFWIDDVRQTDREAILVRTDLPRDQLMVSHPQHGNFTHLLEIPTIGFSLTRGWCSVDVCTRGDNFRYICAHLEDEAAPPIQVAQAFELLAGPAKTKLPVVLVGDFNSDPLHRDRAWSDPTAYPWIIAAGFVDTWAVLHPFRPAGGLTWGHDEFLADPTHPFDRRIDFVFFRGRGIVPVKAEPIDIVLNRTDPPFWASDHAALAAKLLIK
jgi:endonuclease/exonuclease/phosphatase family metal-dependent hydrolase